MEALRIGREAGGLYDLFNTTLSHPSSLQAFYEPIPQFILWHILKGQFVLKIKPLLNVIFAPMAKQHELPFRKSNCTIYFPFDLLHMDVWGPYN